MIGLVQERMTKRVDGLLDGWLPVGAGLRGAAQSELMRDNLQLAIDTNRRIAELSVRIADQAAGAIQAQAGNGMDHAHHAA